MKLWRVFALWLAMAPAVWCADAFAQAPAGNAPAKPKERAPEPKADPKDAKEKTEEPAADAKDQGAPSDEEENAPADTAPSDEAPSDVTSSDAASDATEFADNDPRALTDFKPYLDPHGRWVEDERYGLIWVPNPSVVGADFAPYVSSGHWALTEAGNWIWVSDYPFGWVVFHYGRWVWTDGNGWAWIPGRAYSNAWVVWRVPTGTYDYVGWAPAPPGFIWRNGVAVSLWYSPSLAYVFVPSYYVFSPFLYSYVVFYPRTVRFIAHHTRRYHAPSVRVRRNGPTFSSARIPPEARPRRYMSVDPRARAASTLDGTSRLAAGRIVVPPTPARPLVERRSLSPSQPNVQRAWRGSRAPSPSPSRSVPYRSAPSHRAPPTYERRQAPSRVYRPERFGPSRPHIPPRMGPSRVYPRR